MDNEDLVAKNKLLEEENNALKEKYIILQNELTKIKEHLKKYTAPLRGKKYYEAHKEELLEKMKSNPVPSEKRKEYNKTYYLKKKEKENQEKNNIII